MAALPIAVTITPPTGSAITFHGWLGWVDGISVSLDRDVRIGQQGSVAQGIGRRASDSKCTAYRFFSTLALASAFIDLIENSPSPTPYVMIDAYGRSISIRLIETLCTLVKCKGPIDGTTQTTHKVEVSINVERLP